jgi:tRNA threonylcarbamoyladenosine biosynthesis protein TsaE
MDQPFYHLPLPDEDATIALAQRLAPVLRTGDVILLEGPIGSGKSAFARAVIRARLGRFEDVPSPTFTLVQTYEAKDGDIWHLDLYRLSHPDEAFELGLDEAFEHAICLIEWPDRLGHDIPKDALTLSFSADRKGHSVAISAPPSWLPRLGNLNA